MLTTGFPVKIPVLQASINPFSTAGMKFVGTDPPNTELTNSNSFSDGENLTLTKPNCPAPPDCFLCLPSTSEEPLIVSL